MHRRNIPQVWFLFANAFLGEISQFIKLCATGIKMLKASKFQVRHSITRSQLV